MPRTSVSSPPARWKQQLSRPEQDSYEKLIHRIETVDRIAALGQIAADLLRQLERCDGITAEESASTSRLVLNLVGSGVAFAGNAKRDWSWWD